MITQKEFKCPESKVQNCVLQEFFGSIIPFYVIFHYWHDRPAPNHESMFCVQAWITHSQPSEVIFNGPWTHCSLNREFHYVDQPIQRNIRIRNVNEYPSMHHFGTPTLPVNVSLYDFDWIFLEIPVKKCIMGILLWCPKSYWYHCIITVAKA